jgi:hypothetical protein
MPRHTILLPLVLLLPCCASPDEAPPPETPRACTKEEQGDLFERRIAPLLAEDRPTSCNECHLSGIDLSLFVGGDACRTMACMTERGLVDLERPEDSKILQWIARASPTSPLITGEIVQQEYDGFREWIEWSASCGADACGLIQNPCSDGSAEPTCTEKNTKDGKPAFVDPGDCSERTREALFRYRVYAWRGRCSPCHLEGGEDPPSLDIPPPKWIDEGPCDQASLATMRTVLASNYIDDTRPDQSLLLLKPLAESIGGVPHGGGDKFHALDDEAYRDILDWITREQECRAAP